MKIWGTLVTVAALGVALQGGDAFAQESTSWGPQDRPTYTWQSPADHRVFNSITDNPTIGDERNFMRIREADANQEYTDEIVAEAGKYYEIFAYYHNNASASLNESGKGIANNVRMSVAFPSHVKSGHNAVFQATITATNTDPEKVWASTFLDAKEDLHLQYVKNSATLHTDGSADGQILDGDSLLSDGGAKLAYWNNSWGIIPGCNEYAGYVTFRVLASAEGTPETPEEEIVTTTTTPGEMPDTGPGEVILASVVAVAIIGGAIYYIRSKKAIRRIRK